MHLKTSSFRCSRYFAVNLSVSSFRIVVPCLPLVFHEADYSNIDLSFILESDSIYCFWETFTYIAELMWFTTSSVTSFSGQFNASEACGWITERKARCLETWYYNSISGYHIWNGELFTDLRNFAYKTRRIFLAVAPSPFVPWRSTHKYQSPRIFW